MSQLVVNGAMCTCSFGVSPGALSILPIKKVNGVNLPIATIMDHAPGMNVAPFGLCNSLANPTVATATTAALGVLTPMPCMPATPAPWVPGKPMVMVGKVPALDATSKLSCLWGGVISVAQPGQVTVDAK